MNALGHFNNPTAEEYKDVSDDADSWDGIDLVSSKHSNNHRTYKWNSDFKELLKTYKKKVNGGVDVTKWTFKAEKYQISATKIIGKTLFTNLEGGRGEKKQSEEKFEVNFNK